MRFGKEMASPVCGETPRNPMEGRVTWGYGRGAAFTVFLRLGTVETVLLQQEGGSSCFQKTTSDITAKSQGKSLREEAPGLVVICDEGRGVRTGGLVAVGGSRWRRGRRPCIGQ
jgi:hypothetical protein